MSIPCDKTILLVPSSRSSVKVNVSFQIDTLVKCKTFTLDITFELYDIGPSYLTWEFIVTRLFCLLQFKVISQGQGQVSSSYLLKMQTLTLDITFEWYDVGLSYFTCDFLVTRP